MLNICKSQIEVTYFLKCRSFALLNKPTFVKLVLVGFIVNIFNYLYQLEGRRDIRTWFVDGVG